MIKQIQDEIKFITGQQKLLKSQMDAVKDNHINQ